MATSSDSVKKPEYVDFDEYIDIQLRKAGSTIKTTDVMTAVVGILTLVTLYLLIFVICDHWIIPGGFGPVSRGVMLGVVAVAACGWFVAKVVWPWRRRVSGLYAASTIEKASPAFKSSLLNLVDLSRSGHEIRPEIYESIERRAALALTHLDVNETVDRRSLLRLSNVLLVVVVLFSLYWIFSPKNPATSLWRAMIPAAHVGVATRTEIYNVRPGDKDVLARTQLEISADLRGEIPSQTFLYFTTADHKFVDERIEMRLENESSKRFRCVLTGDNGAGLLQNISYRIVAGDATTPEYKIRVLQPPTATIESIRMTFPEYTRREPLLQTTGAIDALEGTKVTLKATANMPLRSPASLQFFDDESAAKRAEEIPIRVDGTKLQAEWKLEIRSDGTYPHYYRIFCTNEAGESDPSPSLYSLAIRRDQNPEVILHDPKGDLKLPANTVLPLLIEARDPDFALSYIDLNIEKDGSPINGPTIYQGNDQQFKTTYKWSLREYQLRPGDTITYWLQAKDNRQPIANTFATPKLRIQIIEPVPEDQVKKNLDMAQKRQQEQEEVNKSEAERNAQEKPDDDQKTADAGEKQPKQQRERPRNNARPQQSEQPQKPGKNDAADNQNDRDSQTGGDQQQQQPGEGKGQDNAKDKDKNARADRDNSKKSELNPDDPADDSKVLQKVMDQQQAEKEKQKQPSKGEAGRGAGDQGKPDKNSASQDPQKQNDSGSSSDSPQNAKPRDDKPRDDKTGDAGRKEQQDPAEGTKSAGQQNGQQGNQSQSQQETKDSAGRSGEKKSESNGSKPQNGKSPESKNNGEKTGNNGEKAAGEKSAAEQEQKAADPNGSNPKGAGAGKQPGDEQKAQNGAKNGEKNPPKDSAAGASDAKQKDENAGKRPGDQPGTDHRPDAASKDRQPDPKSEKQDGSKAGTPSDDPSKSGRQPERNPDTKQQPGSQEGSQDSKDQHGGPKKSDAQQQNGAGDGAKQNDASDKSGAAKKQSTEKSDAAGSKKADGSPPEQGSKPDASEQGGKEAANQKEAGQQSKPDEGAKKENGSPGETGQKPEGNQKGRLEARKDDRKNRDAANPEKSDAAPPEGAKGQRKPRDDRRPNKQLNEEPPPNDIKANGERSKSPSDKQDPRAGQGESETGPKSDKAGKEAAQKQATSDPSAQKSGAQQEGAQAKKSDQQAGAGQKQSADSKGGAQKPGGQKDSTAKESSNRDSASKDSAGKESPKEGGQQGSDQKGKPQGGQQGQGKEGSQGQGQGEKQGQGQAQGQQGQGGKEGQQGASKTPGKGGKQGEGNGKSEQGNAGGGFNNGASGGSGEALIDTTKQANLNYAKQATDLVLNKLESQLKRGQIDPKLQDELGWNQDQIRRFVERMRKQSQAAEEPNSPAAEARRLQFEETLKSLNLQSTAKKRSSEGAIKTNDSEIEGKRSIPPPEYRDLYNAFTKSLQKSNAPSRDDDKK